MTDEREERYPLYPSLSDKAAEEAQTLLENFKEQLKKAANDALDDIYCNVVNHIESDSWTNFRNAFSEGVADYKHSKLADKGLIERTRRSILKHHRDELINDLNQDLVEEIAELKAKLKQYKEWHFVHDREGL